MRHFPSWQGCTCSHVGFAVWDCFFITICRHSVNPWSKAGEYEYGSRFLVEFEDASSIPLIEEARLPGFSVARIAGDAQLQQEYFRAFTDFMEVDDEALGSSHGGPSGSPAANVVDDSNTRQALGNTAFGGDRALSSRDLAEKSRHTVPPQARELHNPTPPYAPTSPHKPPSLLVRIGSSVDGVKDSLPKHVVVTLHGESINLDLDTLDNDPRAAIALLQATKSERDKWILVAAYYRRKQLPQAAGAVTGAMIDCEHTDSLFSPIY
jgi:hypothetical protein